MEYAVEVDRRQRKRQAVHQNLLDAAAELFQERGLGGTTVDDIAEAADVARQTLFNHFPYKEALALELTADGMSEITCRAHACLEAGVPALDVLQRVAEQVLIAAADKGELAATAARELLHPDPDRASRAARILPLCELFEAILTQAREEGALGDDLPLHVVAEHLSAVLRSGIMHVSTRGVQRLQSELAVYFEMIFNGIRRRD